MQNFKEIGPAVCSGEYPGMKNGGTPYNMSQPVDSAGRGKKEGRGGRRDEEKEG